MWKSAVLAIITAIMAGTSASAGDAKSVELLNVSYDPTRELLRAIGAAFSSTYAKEKGVTVTIKQSHGGSGAQARAVVDGLDADVVTLAMWPDTDAIRKLGLISEGWDQRFPNNSVPWTSTIVFVVRKGNPKGITDWPDIVEPGIEIVTPNPKTSGNGKFSFLAAWGSVIERGGTEQEARDFVTKLYKQAPVLDSGARGSTTTFAQKQIGDVHLTWENEAYLELAEARGEFDLVYPPISVLAEPPVAVVDANVKRKGTREAAEAYLNFLYTPKGQEIIAENYYRPINVEVLSRHAGTFKEIKRFPITAVAKDWNDVYKKFFVDGAIFDSIYKPGA
jgi:sulfate transport system substrate-binding protein